jgi:hypothetical protein
MEPARPLTGGQEFDQQLISGNNRTVKHHFLRVICLTLGFLNWAHAGEVWNSFELRYHSPAPAANGETDFRGETEVFDTAQRIDYLTTYEKVAGEYFKNPDWDQLVVPDEEAKSVLATIKPQPMPEVRNRVPLRTWRWLGFKQGILEKERTALEQWQAYPETRIEDGSLIIGKTSLKHSFEKQRWRFRLRWTVSVGDVNNRTFRIGNAFETGFLSDGSLFYEDKEGRQPVGLYEPNRDYIFETDVDLENGGFNLSINGREVAGFRPTASNRPVDELEIVSEGALTLKSLYGEGYAKAVFTEDTNSRDVPYTVTILVNEDFIVRPDIKGWSEPEYDDSGWETCELPYPHGGERFKGESLYLRKNVKSGNFGVAELNIETLDPGGEIWINGEIVHVQHDRMPVKIDVTTYLKKNTENLVAIRIFPNEVTTTNRHTSMDLHTGWFSGRAWLDFRSDSYIKDLFVYASEISDALTMVQVDAVLRNDRIFHFEREMKTDNTFYGGVKVAVFPWFPEESAEAVFEKVYPVSMRLGHNLPFSQEVTLTNPELWTPESPKLYRVVATLVDQAGNPVDDQVVTTGLRVISQDGGTFRLNGEPYAMNGALLFGYKYPLEDIARTLRCGPDYWLVKQLMMVKRLNGNTIRMSIHHGNNGGVNDPRFAEYGDQLGVMFQWSTGTWVRSGSPWQVEFDELPIYVKQVRNHPSIIMWQPGNHPKFMDYANEGRDWMEQVYNAIYPYDPSRLISPTANNSRFGDDGAPNSTGTRLESGKKLADPGVWNAPMIARGDMEHATGYATDWSTLRKFPYPDNFEDQQGWRRNGFRVEYLNSPEKAWFDFESEESAGHPNQELRKGKPYSGYRSYEKRYDDETIGRRLASAEWRESQAWQGFSAFEAYKKKRWLDYDGQVWCTLHGGGNSATYEKPLIDYTGHSKIAFHTVKMALQEVLACSGNVDLVYGPKDTVPVMVMNLGDEKTVTVAVRAKDLDGKIIQEKIYPDVTLPAGRSATRLEDFAPDFKQDGYVIMEYSVIQ